MTGTKSGMGAQVEEAGSRLRATSRGFEKQRSKVQKSGENRLDLQEKTKDAVDSGSLTTLRGGPLTPVCNKKKGGGREIGVTIRTAQRCSGAVCSLRRWE